MKNYLNKYWLRIVLILFSFTPVLWFWKRFGDTLIDGVDTNFPLNPLSWFIKRFFVWLPVNGGFDFSSSTAGIFFHLVQTIPFLALRLQVAEILSLVFWFSMLILSSYTLAKVVFKDNKFSQLVFVCLYTFNTYLFNTWENVKVSNIALVVGIPLLLSIFIKLNRKQITKTQAFFYTIISALIASGTGINPAYFICMIIPLFFLYVATLISNFNKENIVNVSKNFLLIIFASLVVNAFWMIPTAYYILKTIPTNNSILGIGFTNWVDSLSEHTNIFNVMRIQGAWDWYAVDSTSGLPLYIPYSSRYFNSFPFILFSILLPGLSIMSIALMSLFKRKENKTLVVASILMIMVGVFLGVGTHKPTGTMFLWLSTHIPFFSLFRSPWYIFTPIVVLSYAFLTGSLVNFLRNGISKKIVNLLALIFVLANLIYCYPLITGKIFRPGRHDTFYINFPEYIFEAFDWLKDTPQGRVIGYPDDEIEQYKWGYRGIESILELGSSSEVLFSPLNSPEEPTAVLIKDFYDSLKRHEFTSFINIARKLNISLLFNKKDQDSITLAIPDSLPLKLLKTFGDWEFYSFDENFKPDKIGIAEKIYFASPYTTSDKSISSLSFDSHIVNPNDKIISSIPDLANNLGNIIVGSSSVSDTNVNQDVTKVFYTFTLPKEGIYKILLQSYKIQDFGLPIEGNLTLDLDGVPTNLKIEKSGDYISTENKHFSSGKHELKIDLKSKNLVNFPGQIELSTQESNDATADFQIIDFDPLSEYLVRAKYQLSGSNYGEVRVDQHRREAKLKVVASETRPYIDWNTFGIYLKPVISKSEATISLSAKASTQNSQAKVNFKDLEVKKAFTNTMLLVEESEKSILSTPKVNYKKISPVLYKGHVEGQEGNGVLFFLENYNQNWELKIKGANNKHFTIDKYANAWYVEGAPESYDFEIYYKSQDIYKTGLAISGISILASTAFVVLRRKNK